ncbi:MAG: hypothetical protein U0R26_11355 [Solirubrobacterales bacterium]
MREPATSRTSASGPREAAGGAGAEDEAGVAGAHGGAASHAGDDGAVQQLDELDDRFVGAAAIDAAAGDHDGALRAGEQRGGLVELGGPAHGAGARVTWGGRVGALGIAELVEDRRRQLDVGGRAGRSTSGGTPS